MCGREFSERLMHSLHDPGAVFLLKLLWRSRVAEAFNSSGTKGYLHISLVDGKYYQIGNVNARIRVAND